MTVLLAAKQGDKVILASDKMVSWWQYSNSTTKQFTKRKLTLAYTGDVRTAQVIQHKLELPPFNEDHTEDSYIFEISQNIKSLLQKEAMLVTKDNVQYMSCQLLIVGLSKIYDIDNNFCFLSYDKVAAAGCGQGLALGAFLVQDTDLDLRKRVENAITVVNNTSLFCGYGMDVVELDMGNN